MSGALKVAIVVLSLVGAAALTVPTLSAYSSASGNLGSSFATAATYTTCPNQTVTSGYTSGFESGRLGFVADIFNQGSGAVIDSTVARTGTYSLKIAAAGAMNFARLSSAAAPNTQTTRVALRLASLPAGNVNQLVRMTNNAGPSAELRYIAATQKLAVALTGTSGGPTTVVQAASTVTAGAWNVIEIRYAVASATHTADWQLNGVAQTSASIAGSATFISDTNLGTTAAETFTANYDDVLLGYGAAPYPLGDGRVRALSPNGVGTHVGAANFTDDDGTAIDATSWQRLDEIPTNTIADFIQTTGTSTSYAEFTFADTTETCIRAVTGFFSTHNPTGSTNRAKVSVLQGAQQTILRDTGLSTSASNADYGKLVVPTSTWTQAAVNGLVARFGGATSADSTPPPILDNLLLEYEIPQ